MSDDRDVIQKAYTLLDNVYSYENRYGPLPVNPVPCVKELVTEILRHRRTVLIMSARAECGYHIEGHCQGMTSDGLTHGTQGAWIVDPATNHNRFTRVPRPICVPCFTYLTFTRWDDPLIRVRRSLQGIQEAISVLNLDDFRLRAVE